jgi:hypothetical protein
MGRRPKKIRRKNLNISLLPETITLAKRIADNENKSLSELIECLLVDYMGGASSSTATAGERPTASSTGRKSSAAATRNVARAKAEQ